MRKIDIGASLIVLLIALGVGLFFWNLNRPIKLPASQGIYKKNFDAKKPTLRAMTLTSPAFKNGQLLPAKFTCDGQGINPPLVIGNVPSASVALAVILEDPDAPGGTFTHWLVWNVAPTVKIIPENSTGGATGVNDFGRSGYGAPCPPAGGGTHHYIFKVLALDKEIDFPSDAIVRRSEFDRAVAGHILASAKLVGTYFK